MPKETMDEGMDPMYQQQPEEAPEEETETQEGEEESETLVPKDMLPDGCKPGDTYTFKVVADYGDEVGVSLVEEEEPEDETESSGTDKEIEALDTED